MQNAKPIHGGTNMCINRYLLKGVIVFGAVCAGLFRVVAADDDLTYQSLTNLGPCASSRVLLMNNDTNPICPIQGQGYHDTSNTVEVGQTYWWHDDTPFDEKVNTTKVADIINLQTGIEHILYQKQAEGLPPVELWHLFNCRDGSAACNLSAQINYLPWSSTCMPIDNGTPVPIPDEYTRGEANSNGMKQVAAIVMRASKDAAIYSPMYEEGIGEIYFDAVNFMTSFDNSHIAVEIATSLSADVSDSTFETETKLSNFYWKRIPCEVFKVIKNGAIEADVQNDLIRQTNVVTEARMSCAAGRDNQFLRIRAKVNYNGPIRFRIIRTDLWRNTYLDYQDIIVIDNIVASYPVPKVSLAPTGIDSGGTGKAKIGRVGAFTEPLLSIGLEGATPRMKYQAETNWLPSLPFINWNASVTNSDFIWRWHYLNQDYASWTTNKMTLAESGKELIGNSPITVGNNPGDIEYYYVADVVGTRYKYFDFAHDVDKQQNPYTNEEATVSFRYPNTDVNPSVSNYWSRIREGVSYWQEMHLVAEVYTNLEVNASVTNDWVMELTSDHTWRGFVETPTNYTDKIAHIRFVGKNLWETNAVQPVLESTVWYFPPSVSQEAPIEIPFGSVAYTNLGDKTERDIPLDCSSGYLIFEFNDESGSFIMNRAEYQDFNLWTPGLTIDGLLQPEDRYIGNYMNTSYVGRVKQAYTLELQNLPMSRSSSSYWWENFDDMTGDQAFPFNVPFTDEKSTPNGWSARNGMYINGLFSAVTNKDAYGMALQLQGCGNGVISLANAPDMPNGLGTVSFSARLAQYQEGDDFYIYCDGMSEKNYAISAKASMTTRKQPYCDVSTGSPSLSLVAYYKNGQGFYEFRITRIYATDEDHLWDGRGVMEIAIYKWSKTKDVETGNLVIQPTKLKSLRLGNNTSLVPAAGRQYTNGNNKVNFQNYFVPSPSKTDNSDVPDNRNWTSIYFAAYTRSDGSVYLEGGVGGDTTTSIEAQTELMNATGIMMSLSVTDSNNPLKKGGTYGVGMNECPGVFGNIQKHTLLAEGPYKGKTSVFGAGNRIEEEHHFDDGDWGPASMQKPGRLLTWKERKEIDGVDYVNPYGYGVCTAPLSQQLFLRYNWQDSGMKLNLTSYISTNIIFEPRTTVAISNVQIAVGGRYGDARTDVVVDDIQLAQWTGDTSATSDLGSMTKWAYTDAWISDTTNVVYQSAGSVYDSDDVASISKCGYFSYKINGTDYDYIYVFTNTMQSGSFVTFTPKMDLSVEEVFILGGGGGGGPGGGGGGGGEALWITNAVDYSAGEEGLKICVGTGGGGGTDRYSDNAIQPEGPSNGGTSYVWMKNPFIAAETVQYQGYGGYRGGWFYDGDDSELVITNRAGGTGPTGAGGGSAVKVAIQALGHVQYATGKGGKANDGAPGGGGGGGLRGIGAEGSNSAGGALNPQFVISAGADGEDGTGGATGGSGGEGFSIAVMGDSPVREAIGDLLGDQDAWLGGGGGGGSGKNTPENVDRWGNGAEGPGLGGHGNNGGGGQGGLYTDPNGVGKNGKAFTGGGGGGGSYYYPVTEGSNPASNWIRGGGKGADGLVVMHVRLRNQFAMLQPMRGHANSPMSVRTPFLNGISQLSFSWKDADSNAVLRVQVATNGVDGTTIRSRTTNLSDGWTDVTNGVIRFKNIDSTRLKEGSTNVLIGMRAPIKGIARILVEPSVVADARVGSTNNLYSMYGTVLITGMKVYDEPELDDRSWWGWNIMPTYRAEWSSLYDPDTLGPGRSCGLNFTGILSPAPEGDPDYYDALFADDPAEVHYEKHDPFVQTPRFTNSIGTVSFQARLLDDFSENAWVTVSACQDPAEDDDDKWDVLTNIEIKAETKFFRPYSWRIPTSKSHYQALRLSTFAAAGGRDNIKKPKSGQKFGDSDVNPTPIRRVLIDEVIVTQPMAPKIAFVNAYPFRMKLGDDEGYAIAGEVSAGPDAQPLLGEMFGFQALVKPMGMEDELDRESIRVYMSWYSGDSPWGYENWKTNKDAIVGVELARAADWSPGNLVYRSASTNMAAFVPPQLANDQGYQIVQYHIWAEYNNKNNIEQDPHDISANDWTTPGWYHGIDDPNRNGEFCAYTVLDTISPKRAWFNEINVFDGNVTDKKHQFIEVAVPQGFDMTGWSLHFIRNDGNYTLYQLANFGSDIVQFKSANATNSYAFIAVQSPETKSAGSYPGVDDGTWKSTAFESGVEDVSSPYALRFRRPIGIIEHDVVFMATNTSTSRVRYQYEGTNLLKELKAKFPDNDWVYAGADAYSGSLGVYTNHGETTSCWTNNMQQTPGKVNLMADGTPQFIDPNYFDPPGGTNLWIYANVDGGSVNSLEMVLGNVTNTSAVIIVPQDPNTGTFSTSIVYVVRKWFELDSVVTNEYGKSGGAAETSFVSKDAKGSIWTLDLSNIKLSENSSRKFDVMASTRYSSNIPDVNQGGISPSDPYYPAVIDWLQNFEEKKIHLAPFWTMTDEQVYWNEKPCTLNLKEMYWFNIPPVTDSDTDEWVLKGGMGSGAVPNTATNITAGGLVTNIRVAVTMMITNRNTNVAYPPNMLRGLEPGSTSYDYNEKLPYSSWTSVTFKVTGALQNGRVNKVYRPLRWFTFGPDSFNEGDGFTRVVEVKDPFSPGSPGYSYEWYKHPGCQVLYRWRVDDDETNRPPVTVYQLNDDNALLTPANSATP